MGRTQTNLAAWLALAGKLAPWAQAPMLSAWQTADVAQQRRRPEHSDKCCGSHLS